MCGIAGGVGSSSVADVRRMCEVMRYRGPDHSDVRQFGPAVLGMVRLAIIDVAGGSQPISNETGDVWTVFNGEIYNYEDLRSELRERGHVFRTHSDTETIVHAYEEYGDSFPEHLRGMFAIAVWDLKRQRLLLVRDRLGEKPLYYHQNSSGLTFASEIKCLLTNPGNRYVDRESAATFLALGYIPAPATAFLGIRKLCPGEIAIYERGQLSLHRYWSLLPRQSIEADYAHAVDQLDAELREAIRYCLKSDVEVAAFLSGGVDSSLISALMQQGGTRVRTYSIGFDASASGFSELGYAEQVAAHLGTEHRNFVVTAQQAVDLIPRILDHYDEPNGEPTSILVHLLCKEVVKDVKVAMGGTGGDELFHGYPRHGKLGMLALASRVPGPLASLGQHLLGQFSDSTDGSRFIRRAKRFGRALGKTQTEGYRQWLMQLAPEVGNGLVLGVDPIYVADQYVIDCLGKGGDFHDRVLEVDTAAYLPEFQLTYMDRMSMANSLEVRSPLCDFRIAEFAAGLPAHYRVHNGRTKRILKDVARRYLPASIVDRPKTGFDAPVGLWFKSALRQWMTRILDPRQVAETGLLDPDKVDRLVQGHLHGRQDYSMQLWSLLSLEYWHRKYIEDGSRLDTSTNDSAVRETFERVKRPVGKDRQERTGVKGLGRAEPQDQVNR
jgi:asparagine synthase (glutamine-hydrolysing)